MNRKLPDRNSVVKVGDGRGFVVSYRIPITPLKLTGPIAKHFRPATFDERRLVITAAHCLPHLPPPHPVSYAIDRTYQNLIGKIGGKRDIWTECRFVDPVADLAVLGHPDSQDLGDESLKFEVLTTEVQPLPIAPAKSCAGWVLSLDRRWIRSDLKVSRGL